MTDSTCLFCEKLSHLDSVPAEELLWQFPSSIVLLGSWQRYHGYCILVHRQHQTELFHLDGVQRQAYMEEMALLGRAVAECFHPHKLNYELLGNQVPHLHWHLFPRYRDDPHRLQPVWLALDRAEADPEVKKQLQTGPLPRGETASRLRQKLQELSAGTA